MEKAFDYGMCIKTHLEVFDQSGAGLNRISIKSRKYLLKKTSSFAMSFKGVFSFQKIIY